MRTQNVFTILADADRRRILHELIETDGQTTIEELSCRLLSRRQEAATEAVTDRKREQTKIDLVHNHLPRLEDRGVIEYDVQSGEVELDDAEDIKPFLEHSATRTRAISREW